MDGMDEAFRGLSESVDCLASVVRNVTDAMTELSLALEEFERRQPSFAERVASEVERETLDEFALRMRSWRPEI